MPNDTDSLFNPPPEATSSMPIARAADVLPSVIHLLPNPARPFFPGQVMPVLLAAARGPRH